MKKLSKLITFILIMALTITFFMTGCGASNTKQQQGQSSETNGANGESTNDTIKNSSKDLITALVKADPGTLRYSNVNVPAASVGDLVIEPLLRSTPDGYEYLVAENIQLDEDGMGITVYIRKDIKFSDGSKVTADDLIFSYLMQYGDYISGYCNFVDNENIKIIDDSTVYFPFKQPTYLWQIGFGYVKVYSKAAYEQVGENAFWTSPVATGAFYVEDWIDGDSITLRASKNYWDEGPYVERVRMRVVSEDSVAMMEIQTGGADYVFRAGTEILKTSEKDNTIVVNRLEGSVTTYIGFNHRKEMFDDIRIRQALMYLTDVPTIISGSWDGAAMEAHSYWGSRDVGYYPDMKWDYSYDVEKAKALLSDAGIDKITLTIVCDTTANRALVAEQLYNMFASAGVTLDIQVYDSATATDIVKNTNDWDLFIRGLGSNAGEKTLQSIRNPASLGLMHIEEGGSADIWKEIQDLANTIEGTNDIEQRIVYYKKIQDLITENALWITMYRADDYTLASTNLKDYYFAQGTGSTSTFFNKAYFE